MNLSVIVFLVLLAALLWLGRRETIGGRGQARNRARAIRWRIRLRLRPGPGFASFAELAIRWSRTAAVFSGRRARPGLRLRDRLFSPAVNYAVRLGRAQYGKRIFARLEDQVLMLAPPRVGKTGMLADRIIDHPGAVVCTSTRADLFTSTAAARAARGPVAVFNPQGVGGLRSTFGWNLIRGCEDPAVAARRAEDLTGGVTPTGDMAFWLGKASIALAAMLHAAALAPAATIIDVFGWVNRDGDKMAEDILASHPDASRPLLGVLTEIRQEAKYADSVRMTMSKSLAWVAIPQLAAAACPADGEGFDAARFARDRGTLYMIAPGDQDSPEAPLFRALASHMHHAAGLAGSRTRAGRLDPPLFLALDECTQICPVPLPEWLSDSAGKGITICAVVHGIGQLEARWGKHGANTIWATSGTKILLGGISDADTLEDVSQLCGSVTIRQGEGTETVPVVPPAALRQLPEWRALVLRANLSPVVVKVRPVWKRLGHRFGRTAPLPVLTPALPAPLARATWPVPAPAAAPVGEPLSAGPAASTPAAARTPARPPLRLRREAKDA